MYTYGSCRTQKFGFCPNTVWSIFNINNTNKMLNNFFCIKTIINLYYKRERTLSFQNIK